MARLPRNVESQGKRADELLRKLVAQDQAAAAPGPGKTDPGLTTPPAPQDPTEPPAPSPPAPEPAPEPTAAPAPGQEPAPPVPAGCPECSKWQHKYSVLQGKYDAEVPRLTYRVSFLENQIEDLKKQGEKTDPDPGRKDQHAAIPGGKPSAAAGLAGLSDVLKASDDETIKTFRENFPDVFAPMAKILDDFGGQILKRSEERIAAIEKSTKETKQEAFVRALNEAHADWQTVCQTDPGWPVWLNKADRYGRKPLDVLKDAQARLDAGVVVTLLSDFKKETGEPPAPPPPIPAPNPAAGLITPPSGPSARAGGAGPSGQVEPVARSFINQFYQDKAKGKYRGREKEAEAIENKINAALTVGKVVDR